MCSETRCPFSGFIFKLLYLLNVSNKMSLRLELNNFSGIRLTDLFIKADEELESLIGFLGWGVGESCYSLLGKYTSELVLLVVFI